MAEANGSAGLRLLSLDGGGIRGLSELIILREIMYRIQVAKGLPDVPHPCDWFDLVGGTSTGGLITIMLVRLRLSVDDAINAYARLAKKVFSERKWRYQDGLFKATNLENAIVGVIADAAARQGPSGERMLDARADARKGFVCATAALNMATPRLFRTYTPPKNPTYNCTILEATRATSAAPTFFKRIAISDDGLKEEFIDGGLRCNNPINQVLEEASLIFPADSIACIVSIGTGQRDVIGLKTPDAFQKVIPTGVMSVLKGIATDCEAVASSVGRRFIGIPDFYFRFNVNQGLQGVSLAEWDRLAEVKTHTEEYLKDITVDKQLDVLVRVMCMRPMVVPTVNQTQMKTHHKKEHLKQATPVSPLFTGRKDILQQMKQCFSPAGAPQPVATHRIFVLYGLGGSGKTQIAVKFLQQEWNLFRYHFFVDASSKNSIEESFKSIASYVGLEGDFDLQETLDWLTCNDGWILILDNADDPKINLHEIIPICNHGSIIITSRNQGTCFHSCRGWSAEVGGMDKEDAIQLLLTTAQLDTSSETYATALSIVEKFDFLALAIVQAGAYICQSTAPVFQRYLAIYETKRKELLESKPIQTADNYQWSVYTTWELSFAKLDRKAAQFLQVCSFFHHMNIGEEIFKEAFENRRDGIKSDNSNTGVMGFLSIFRGEQDQWDQHRFDQIINELGSFSLIRFTEESQFSIHPIVQSWTCDRLSKEERSSVHDIAVETISASIIWRFETEDFDFRQRLLLHVTGLELTQYHGDDVLVKFALVYGESGHWNDAEKLEVAVLEARKHKLGEDHPSTLTSMANLAHTYRNQGHWDDAEKLSVAVLEARKHKLGEDHPSTLTSMANLAFTYQNQGHWDDAEKLEVAVLEASKHKLGEDHPSTLTSMANLAFTYQDQGHWDDAEKLEVAVLEASKHKLGEDHPSTLTIMGNLACTYRDQGRWDDAEKLEVTVLEASKHKLGEDHPDTLTSMANLACTYRDQGRWDDAEKLEVAVLEARKHKLGEDHPDTLTSMANLACTYRDQGHWDDAEKLEVAVLEARKHKLGEDHPSTLTSMANLACTYRNQGRWDDAEKLEVAVLEARKHKLGEDHPSTLTSMVNLAFTYWDQGRWDDAEKLEVAVLEARKHKLGEDHPSTLTSMANLACTCQNQGH